MVILKIWFSEYPWDVRVEKILNALLSSGHEVHLLCRNNRGEVRDEKGSFYIHRLPYLKKGKSILNKIINLPVFLNPLWFFCIVSNLKKYRIDLIIVRDLPLTLPAIIVGKLFGKKVIFDMAECHTEIFKNYFKWRLKSIFKENPWIAFIVEKITIKFIDHVLVMCEESKMRLVSLGIKESNISVISNTTRIIPREKPSQKKDEIRLIYVGMMGEFRGLDTVIDAMPILLKRYNLNVYFDVIGNVGDYLKVLKSKVIRMNLNEKVVFHGWVDNKEIYRYIDNADIGVLPLWKLSHYDVTVSNKLFDYMACSIPVVSSNTTAMARIVTETGCGLVFEDRSVEHFVNCVLKLCDPLVRLKLGENGRKAVVETYNWNTDSKRMLKVIDELSTSY